MIASHLDFFMSESRTPFVPHARCDFQHEIHADSLSRTSTDMRAHSLHHKSNPCVQNSQHQ